jgi:SAM-dependent methyltransferase
MDDSRTDYYRNLRPEMLPFIPAEAGRILEVGCGSGAFAGHLRQERESAGRPVEIWGVEMDADAAVVASGRIDRLLQGDAADILPGLPAGHFDCVVLNDVIEHVLEPGDLLRAVHRVLEPGGHLVASIPNVRYFFNVVDLAVHGRWDYTDEGILDRTHLRFFTRGSMVRLLEEAGFTVEDTVGINPTGSLKFRLANLLTLGRWSDMKYLQFACLARAAGGAE